MKRLAAAVSLLLSLACFAAAPALAAPAVTGTFPVPGIQTNSKIVAGPDGNMWATVQEGENDVARITPSGAVQEFEIADLQQVQGIAVGPEGKLWVTGVNKIASFSPSDPKGTASPAKFNAIAGPSPIVAGPDGNLWVASQEVVLRIPPSNPTTSAPFPVSELAPKDIDVAGSLIAIADGGKSRVVTFTTSGTEVDFPIGGASQGLAGGPGGQIAFGAAGANPEQVGLIAPPGQAQSSELLGDPFGVAFGSDQAYWIVQFGFGTLTRMTTSGAKTTLTGLPKESARQIAAGPDNTLWVTLDKKEGVVEHEGVARVSGLEPPQEETGTVPQTRITKRPRHTVKTTGKRGNVRFVFSSTVKGSSFECALTKLRKGKKPPKPVFRSCKSPKRYSLKPGKYRFKVRAVASGKVDPSPAFGTFVVVHVAKHKQKR